MTSAISSCGAMACKFFQGGAHGLGDQLQAREVADRGDDVGGVAAVRGVDQAGGLDAFQREVELSHQARH
ncbi:hypothetical protein [Actinorhabdospora filicis]|uniref:hypothetical protein n=1 Tax=Actinorhabdospora filicis TaxID=1785913 RepID=UPI00255610DB|nr:hypothetical protein [Actinorhabdospora filicis]